MLEIAVVGGGLTGLGLANLLRTEAKDYRLFEARSRLGGRIYTIEEPSGLALDLGPTWFWPEENPLLAGLVRALGLESFEQYDQGQFVQASQAGVPRRMPGLGWHAGAYRIVGGVGTLVAALAARLPAERIRLRHELVAITRHTEHVELTLRSEGARLTVRARAVVLAIPPRVVEERVSFAPPLAPALKSALRETPTWMAPHAKALVPFTEPFWRRTGASGSAQAAHPGAVLAEVFDACDASGRAALGGFFALGEHERRSRDELPRLVTHHLAALLGSPAVGGGPVHIQDWASEPFTATALDLASTPPAPLPPNPLLAGPHWDGRLFFGAAETGSQHPGHLEGALESAVHLSELVTRALVEASAAGESSVRAEAAWLEGFRNALKNRRARALFLYRDFIQDALSRQDFEDITRRAVLGAAATVYRGALADLAANVPGADTHVPSLAEQADAVLAPLAGFAEELLVAAIRFNRASCAMQNFPHEARPDTAYAQAIARDLQSIVDGFRTAVECALDARPSDGRKETAGA
jgi:monoamine oxidase